jgi:hypothetical protein
MSDRTTLAELFTGEDEPKAFLVCKLFEEFNVAMTPNTPLEHAQDDGDHVLTAEGVTIRIPGSSVMAHVVEEPHE